MQQTYPGTDVTDIVGVVHLHARAAGPGFEASGDLSNDLDFTNAMPSHPNLRQVFDENGSEIVADDWRSTLNFFSNRNRHDISAISHYILGPDGVLREYDYIDGHPTEHGSLEENIRNAELDADGKGVDSVCEYSPENHHYHFGIILLLRSDVTR